MPATLLRKPLPGTPGVWSLATSCSGVILPLIMFSALPSSMIWTDTASESAIPRTVKVMYGLPVPCARVQLDREIPLYWRLPLPAPTLLYESRLQLRRKWPDYVRDPTLFRQSCHLTLRSRRGHSVQLM